MKGEPAAKGSSDQQNRKQAEQRLNAKSSDQNRNGRRPDDNQRSVSSSAWSDHLLSSKSVPACKLANERRILPRILNELEGPRRRLAAQHLVPVFVNEIRL